MSGRPSPQRMLTSPFAVPAAALMGVLLSYFVPQAGAVLAPINTIYVSLLKMIVLPLILSSLVFSLRRMVRDPSTLRYLGRVAGGILVVSVIAVFIGGSLTMAVRPGELRTQAERVAFGNTIYHGDKVATDLQLRMFDDTRTQARDPLLDSIMSMVPSNVFEALATGDTIKVLVFSILFGLAVGKVPEHISAGLSDALDTTYRACLILTRWLVSLLPIAIIAMLTSQASTISMASLELMSRFLAVLAGSGLLMVAISLAAICFGTGRSALAVVRMHGKVLLMAVTTRSSAACMPVVIAILSRDLRRRRDLVELLVPLLMLMMRAGVILMYVIGVMFIAQLHGRDLSFSDMLVVGFSSIIVAMSTVGAGGISILWQMAVICGYLSLPFEAALPLFVAVETVSDSIRTSVVVAVVSAITAVITPSELESPEASTERTIALQAAGQTA